MAYLLIFQLYSLSRSKQKHLKTQPLMLSNLCWCRSYVVQTLISSIILVLSLTLFINAGSIHFWYIKKWIHHYSVDAIASIWMWESVSDILPIFCWNHNHHFDIPGDSYIDVFVFIADIIFSLLILSHKFHILLETYDFFCNMRVRINCKDCYYYVEDGLVCNLHCHH